MITLDVKTPEGPTLWQPLKDLVAPAPRSDWFRHVVHERGFTYDRTRQFLTRLGLTAVLAICYLALPEVAWWAWALLVLPVVQGVLEIRLEPKCRAAAGFSPDEQADRDRGGLDQSLTQVVISNYEKRPLNVTGILGGFAVAANVLAVAFGTRAGEAEGWIKVTAFLAAVCYANSGSSSPLLEASTYSERASTGQLIRTLRWAAWPALGLLLAGVVWTSDQLVSAWPTTAVPYAYLTCLAAYYLGLRIREHDRAVAAAGVTAAKAQLEGGKRIAQELHDLVQFYKGSLSDVLARDDVDAGDRARLQAFLTNVDFIYAKAKSPYGISVQDSLLPDAKTTVRFVCAPQDIDPDVSGIDLPAPEASGNASTAFAKDSADYAKLIISTLTHNAVQAYSRDFDVLDRPLRVTATVNDGEVTVTVSDALPLIPAQDWLAPGTTLAKIAEELAARQGSLDQIPTPTGKSIIARWKSEAQPLISQHNRSGDYTW